MFYIRKYDILGPKKIIWGTLWGVLAPGLLFLSLGLNIYQSIHTSPYKPEEPVWANVLGIICMLSIFLLIFGTMAWLMLTTKGSFRERGRILREPSQNWGPAKSQHRYMWETLRREDERKKPLTLFGYIRYVGLPLLVSYLPKCIQRCCPKPRSVQGKTDFTSRFDYKRGHFIIANVGDVTTFEELSEYKDWSNY